MRGHGHGAPPTGPDGAPGPAHAARRRLKVALAAVLLPLLLLTVGAVVALGEGRAVLDLPGGLGPGADVVDAEIVARTESPCPTDQGESVVPLPQVAGEQETTVSATRCVQAELELTSGPDAGERVVLDVLSLPNRPFPADGGVVLAFQPDAAGEGRYVFVDVQRDTPLLLVGALFAVAVLVLGRWTGLRALVGLASSLLVVTLFVLPALLAGRNAVGVALAGSGLVLLVSLYLAHGVTIQTSIAVLGTAASLLATVALASVVVPGAGLTGGGSGETALLSGVAGVDLRGLLLAGIVIGSLGVLDDVTVTQAATVWELHVARPAATAAELFRAGLRVGRQHMAATVNTLALAYVGAALPLLVVFSLVGARAQDVVTREAVAQEVVRALVGSLGIVLAVPLTTALAAAAVRVDRHDAG